MPAPAGYQKAHLEIEGEAALDCWFNPNEYTVSKSNDWNLKPIVGATLPAAQFGGGHARELTLDLLFDATDAGDRDVSEVTNRLFKMMEVNPALASGSRKNKGRPPMVTFGWGSTVGFKAVATSLSVRYTLFKPDGTPIRAHARLALQQAEKADSSSAQGASAAQNPTSFAQAGASSHVVREGDSLQSIAYGTYGDPTLWRAIAEANGIDDPMRTPLGVALEIPALER
jgi:hypothetical protein